MAQGKWVRGRFSLGALVPLSRRSFELYRLCGRKAAMHSSGARVSGDRAPWATAEAARSMYNFGAGRDGAPDLGRRFGSKNPKARARLALDPSKGHTTEGSKG
jgi:hypothetical protein